MSNKENCTSCRYCENIHIVTELLIVDDNNILRGTYCGICSRYGMEVSEYDCCSNYEEVPNIRKEIING